MAPFECASDYFEGRAQCFQPHLKAQRNLAGNDKDIACRNFVARSCFAKLIPPHGNVDDAAPFLLPGEPPLSARMRDS